MGTEGVILTGDEEAEEEEEEDWVSVDAIIDIVVVLDDSVDGMFELVVVPGCEVITDSEGSSVPLAVVSGQAPLPVGGVTGVMTGTESTDELVLTNVL